MAEALERVRWVEEKWLLSGRLHSIVFGNHDRAEVDVLRATNGFPAKDAGLCRACKALDSDTEECYWPKQECFLSSSCPAAALAMRVELGQWAEALRLAPDLTRSKCQSSPSTMPRCLPHVSPSQAMTR